MADVNVKFNGLDKLVASISRNLKRTKSSKRTLKQMGEALKTSVVDGLKQGKYFENGKLTSFKESLKETSIQTRKRLAKFNKTSNVFSPNKNNVSFTGQFLRSFKVGVQQDVVSVGPEGARKAYRTGPNSKAKNTPTNEELLIFLEEGGRQILPDNTDDLDDRTKRKLKNIVLRELRRQLK